MKELWVDANVLIRLITEEPPDLYQRALRLFRRAEQGEVSLRILPIVIAESIWVLSSFYRYSRFEIREALLPLIAASGVVSEETEAAIAAIDVMAEANVDFLDAFLAETARRQGGTVVSFDRDFRRLNVDWLEPE